MNKITRQDIEDAVDYVFKNKERSLTKDNSLRIVQDDEYHYYKIGNGLTTGWGGFNNFLDILEEQGTPRMFSEIYFNGHELDEKGVKSFWKQFDEFRAKNK